VLKHFLGVRYCLRGISFALFWGIVDQNHKTATVVTSAAIFSTTITIVFHQMNLTDLVNLSYSLSKIDSKAASAPRIFGGDHRKMARNTPWGTSLDWCLCCTPNSIWIMLLWTILEAYTWQQSRLPHLQISFPWQLELLYKHVLTHKPRSINMIHHFH